MKSSYNPGDLCPNWIKQYISLKRTKESPSIIAANSSECSALCRLHAEWVPRECIRDVMRKKHRGKQIDFFFFSKAAPNYTAGINNSWKGGRHTSVMLCNPSLGMNASCFCLFVCFFLLVSCVGFTLRLPINTDYKLLAVFALIKMIMWMCHINAGSFYWTNRRGG